MAVIVLSFCQFPPSGSKRVSVREDVEEGSEQQEQLVTSDSEEQSVEQQQHVVPEHGK